MVSVATREKRLNIHYKKNGSNYWKKMWYPLFEYLYMIALVSVFNRSWESFHHSVRLLIDFHMKSKTSGSEI